ncbi:MAG TPA: tetratricopeptide repeat protein [Anaeromyxobacteraceae bacterium]|nr:tetratricopeptide repeat protein [Anaeromyxobacteraceae bacterium]
MTWGVALALAIAVAGVYGNASNLGFVNLDDPQYVYQNPQVRGGLTLDGIAWAFTTAHASNWHPLTWVSHMVDVQVFGIEPGPPHVVNVLLHFVASLLLFLFLRSGTGRPWPSATVALLFAVHPLHVESVAWISERKDLLSAVFWMAACLAYVHYARAPSVTRYVGVALALAASLLAKPMAVTLPFVFLLLDYWPLGRMPVSEGSGRRLGRLVLEKLPLFGLSAASSVASFLAQYRGGAVSVPLAMAGPLGLPTRVGNAVLSYVAYLTKAAWPEGLVPLYPHPGLDAAGFPAWKATGAALLLLGVTAAVLLQARKRPYLPVGWFWYLGTLVPVIGLVQIGLQGMADRYTYIPLVGIFVALTWWVADLAGRDARWRAAAALAGVLAAAGLGLVARRQVSYWKDSFTLFGHAVSVNPENWLAWRNLGGAYQEADRHDEAIRCLEESLRRMPYTDETWNALAVSYSRVGRHAEAAGAFRRAVDYGPENAVVWYNFGIECASQGRWDEAMAIEQRLRTLDPALAARLSSALGRDPR